LGASVGTSNVEATGVAEFAGDGSSVGSSLVSAISIEIHWGAGSSDGTSAVDGVGTSIATFDGEIVGSSTNVAVGSSVASAAGSAAGTSTAHANNNFETITADGAAQGTSTAAAVGASIRFSAGNSGIPLPQIPPIVIIDGEAPGAVFVVTVQLIGGNSLGSISIDGEFGSTDLVAAKVSIIGGGAVGEQNLNDDELLILLEAA
jgi:hypothetical protein